MLLGKEASMLEKTINTEVGTPFDPCKPYVWWALYTDYALYLEVTRIQQSPTEKAINKSSSAVADFRGNNAET